VRVMSLATCVVLAGCGEDNDRTGGGGGSGGADGGGDITLSWDFEDGSYQGFFVGITDFEEVTRGGLEHAVDDLPSPLSGKGIRVFADNRSDDLWHFIARELTTADGIVAGRAYDVRIAVDVASNTPSGCIGVGGAPDAVTLKAGVVDAEPAEEVQGDYVGFTADKGNQSEIGSEAVDLGTIGTSGDNCGGENAWELLERSGTMTSAVTATAEGKLWVYAGGDSGFETDSTLYYDRVAVTLRPR
jgi:hypothetical protein